mmetsp:Transcript_17455/g.38237  ORF Transcript_17455/g.38237 Transcript_17455/m.38237 type:complete len:87 (-) Transcript_17455:9-269(-)
MTKWSLGALCQRRLTKIRHAYAEYSLAQLHGEELASYSGCPPMVSSALAAQAAEASRAPRPVHPMCSALSVGYRPWLMRDPLYPLS